MAEEQVIFRHAPRSITGGIVATIALHGGLVFLMYWSTRVEAAPEVEVRDLITTELVKLGKPRDKFWLPKIVRPQRTRPVDAIKIADDPNAAPTPKEAPKPEDTEISNKLRSALSRARSLQDVDLEEDNEGQLTGSELGTAAEARAGDEYATKVNLAIRANWSVPAGLIPDDQLAVLTATVRIRVESDGTIKDAGMHKGSGNNTFDDSCMQAISATAQVPPPPAEVKAMWAKGVGIVFKK
ncbi:MAG: TonB family protein [Deltaproteobacteria bacterium]|nr:TonB family protein [Deltaproteobacteria bacterium]